MDCSCSFWIMCGMGGSLREFSDISLIIQSNVEMQLQLYEREIQLQS